MVRRFTLVITGCLLAIALNAQEIWSLERCIRHAIDNSLLVQSSVINRDFAVVADQQAREARFPNLNVSGSAGLNFGRVVNPATNDFETENSLFNNWGLNTGMILFNSGAVNKSIRQSRLDLEAGNQDLQQTKNDIALQVALAYLNVLFADENVTNGRNTLTLSEAQLEQTDKMIAAGVIPEADRYDILAQIALDERAIVDFVNAYDNAMLSLKHLLLLEPGYPMQIEKPEIDLTNQERLEASSLETVYNAAYARQPEIQAQALRVESALLGEQIAQTQLYPRLTIGGSLGTSYSDLAKQALGFERQRVPIPDVYINGELVQYEVEQDVATGVRTTPYGTQLDNNIGYGFSVSLSVPIYNNYSNRASVERARLNTLQERNTEDQLKQSLKTDIQNALASARSAWESLEASQRAVDAAEIAYDHAERRFGLGTINSFELINARGRLDQATINLTIAKYDYLFKVKIIEYYLGRGLTLR